MRSQPECTHVTEQRYKVRLFLPATWVEVEAFGYDETSAAEDAVQQAEHLQMVRDALDELEGGASGNYFFFERDGDFQTEVLDVVA